MFIKRLFLKISQYSQENTCVSVSFYKVAGLQACNFIKKRLQHWCFPVNIAKYLGTPILRNICEQLLLYLERIIPLTVLLKTLFENLENSQGFQFSFIFRSRQQFTATFIISLFFADLQESKREFIEFGEFRPDHFRKLY